jgi:hypothetical protein
MSEQLLQKYLYEVNLKLHNQFQTRHYWNLTFQGSFKIFLASSKGHDLLSWATDIIDLFMTLLNPNDALIYSMTLSSAIDGEISNKEMQFIQTCINNLPIFKTYNSEDLEKTLSMFFELLSGDNDPETIIELIDQALDKKNKYIAYALSVEIMMVEENFTNEKLRLLELLEKNFEINDLESASIKYTIKTKYSD